MKISKKLKEKMMSNFSHFFKYIWYKLDWRKPRSESIKEFLNEQVEVAKKLIKINKIPTFTGTQDEKVIKTLKWVHGHIKYEIDMKRFNVAEKWQTIEETLNFKRGDCEDGAILIYTICIANGVSPAQLAIVAGDVTGGGHCWVEYACDEFYDYTTDNMIWYTIDWCYWYIDKEFKYRTPKSSNYIKDWFKINHEEW